ncbi:polyprenol monophosphomannose synthase [bacterium]|nr:polyprenol monophosphomannose synthase [bacterium]
MISIILATYNEKENILDTIQNLFLYIQEPSEIIVVDDDSPDQTWKLVEELNDPRVKLIRRVDTRGLASAFNRGIIESTGDIVGWMDADMCMPPSLIPVMLKRLEEDGYDIAVGSRYVEGGKDIRHPLRVYSSRLINWFAGLILGFEVKDYDSGFVLLKRTVFNKVSIIPTGYGAYFIEFLYTAKKKGLKIVEVPYEFKDRQKGISKSAPSIWKFFVQGMGYVIRILVARARKID